MKFKLSQITVLVVSALSASAAIAATVNETVNINNNTPVRLSPDITIPTIPLNIRVPSVTARTQPHLLASVNQQQKAAYITPM